MSKTFVFNTSDTPVLADSDGHTIGGGEWGWADGSPLAAGISTGLFVEAAKPAKDGDPQATAAYAAEDTKTRRGSGSTSDQE